MSGFSFYKATLSPLGDSGVSGEVAVFSANSGSLKTTVCFVGSATGLEPNLDSIHVPGGSGMDCSATNGCGAHVHQGVGMDACTNSTTQGGHFWNSSSALLMDPWLPIGYLTTNGDGEASYTNCVTTGSMEGLDQRAFILHANDGSRVACGIMEMDMEPTYQLLTASTTPLGDSGVTSDITVMTDVFSAVADGVCFTGTAAGLEPELDSIWGLTGGMDCDFTNGCGLHIHSGTGCENTTTQGGHYYDSMTVGVDPWIAVGYEATSDMGTAEFIDCVLTGAADYMDKPFVVHANDGSRVSCGILTSAPVDATDMPTMSPTGMPTMAPVTMATCPSSTPMKFFLGW